MNLPELTELLQKLTALPCVTGFEERAASALDAIVRETTGDFFDGHTQTAGGTHLYRHTTGKKNAKKLLLDAHLDTVGFVVSELCGNGYVRAIPRGGLDVYVLPSTPVTLYGKRDVYGVISSVPPHLKSKDKPAKLSVGDLYIDTGLADGELEETVPVGTPVGYERALRALANDRVAAKYLDDKACVAAILLACKELAEEGYDGNTDVYVCFSAGEEHTGIGAKTLPYTETFDAAIVFDVNFALAPGVKRYESLEPGKGAGVSYSATIRRPLTDFIVRTAKETGIPCQSVVEMRSTGTNATQLMKNGIPCAVLSVPLRSMHTDAECASLNDIVSCGRLAAACVRRFETYAGGDADVLG